MCGICFYSKTCKKSIENKVLNFNKISHRGPDNSSYIIKNGHFFGCHRLAVVNLSNIGNQPL